jgi:hypothetical protein
MLSAPYPLSNKSVTAGGICSRIQFTMRKLLPLILLVMVSTSSVAAKAWRSIVPLHSTRAQVEALLGLPPPPPENRSYTLHEGRSIYYLDEGEVYIIFADKEFLKEHSCPSVALGTVMRVDVTPKNELLVSSLGLNEKSFTKYEPSELDEDGTYEGLIDEQEGLAIRTVEGKMAEMIYFPSATDRGRCPGFYDNPKGYIQKTTVCHLPMRKFDEWGNLRFSDEKARLDNFGIQVNNEEGSVGYIIVYAGRKATVAEAQLRATRARDYLINVRKIDPQSVKAIDGGYLDELTIQLWITPAGAEPPPLMPTIDKSEVELIYEKPKPPKKKRN